VYINTKQSCATGGEEKMMYNYDPLANAWTAISIKGNKLDGCGVTVCGGKLYITGKF